MSDGTGGKFYRLPPEKENTALGLSTTLRQPFRPKYYTKAMLRLKVSISKGLRLFQYR